MMKRICRNYLQTALEEYDAAVAEYIAARDEMMENEGQPWTVYDATQMRLAENA